MAILHADCQHVDFSIATTQEFSNLNLLEIMSGVMCGHSGNIGHVSLGSCTQTALKIDYEIVKNRARIVSE